MGEGRRAAEARGPAGAGTAVVAVVRVPVVPRVAAAEAGAADGNHRPPETLSGGRSLAASCTECNVDESPNRNPPMMAAPLLAMLLQAALPALLPVAAEPPVLEVVGGDAALPDIPLRLGSSDAFGCVWGVGGSHYCRHEASFVAADARTYPVGGLTVSEIWAAAAWRPPCAASWGAAEPGIWGGAGCYPVGPLDSDAYRVWSHQQQVARDFVEQSVGLREGRAIREAQRQAGATSARK